MTDAQDQDHGQRAEDAQLEWTQLTKGRPFIADLGYKPDVLTPIASGPPMELGRFAAFLPLPSQDRHQIVEVSQDVEYLKQKYGVSDDGVFRVGAPATEES